MTLSSDQYAPRGLDAMLIVYSVLDDHPASTVCESFIRERSNWFTTTLTLLEAKAILTKVLCCGCQPCLTATFAIFCRAYRNY